MPLTPPDAVRYNGLSKKRARMRHVCAITHPTKKATLERHYLRTLHAPHGASTCGAPYLARRHPSLSGRDVRRRRHSAAHIRLHGVHSAHNLRAYAGSGQHIQRLL